jgi:hypothetical protein
MAPMGAVHRFRHHLMHEAVTRGWPRHLHHDQRTPEGEQLAAQTRSFRVAPRHLKTSGSEQMGIDGGQQV